MFPNNSNIIVISFSSIVLISNIKTYLSFKFWFKKKIGNVIKEYFNSELDELRSLSISGKDYLNKILEREKNNTGITSLKISFNNVFGYFIEVRNIHKDKVP